VARVPRRARIAVAALLAAAVVVVVVVALVGGSKDRADRVADPTAEALAYADPSAPVAAVISTGAGEGPGARLAALVDRLPGSFLALPRLHELLGELVGLPYDAALKPLLGNPVAVTLPDPRSTNGAQLTFVARDPGRPRDVLDAQVDDGALRRAGDHRGARLYTRADGRAYATRGQVLLAAPSLRAVGAALDRRATRTGLSPRGFAQRLHGIRTGGAIARVAATPAILGRLPRIPWVRAQRAVALALVPERDGLRLRVRIATAPTKPSDLPFAGGPQAPDLHGRAPVVAGVRNPAATLPALTALARATRPKAYGAFDAFTDKLAHYTGVDVQGDVLRRMTGTATVTTDLHHQTALRAVVDDPKKVATTLERLRALARLAPLAKLAGADLGGYGLTEQGDGRYVLTHDKQPQLVLGVRGRTLVASTDPRANLDVIAAAPATPPPDPPQAGAFRALVAKPVLNRLLTERLHLPRAATILLTPVGPATITGRAEPTATDLEVTVPVSG
jgi:hypothetical protein